MNYVFPKGRKLSVKVQFTSTSPSRLDEMRATVSKKRETEHFSVFGTRRSTAAVGHT